MPGTRNRTKNLFQAWESPKPNDGFVKISDTMLFSQAWDSLNLRQQALYFALKRRYRPEVHNGKVIDERREKVVFPESEWSKWYGNYMTFRNDIDVLVERGFIIVALSGQNIREDNLYWFSNEWQKWKPPDETQGRLRGKRTKEFQHRGRKTEKRREKNQDES